MNYNNNITNFLLGGNNEKAISVWKRTLHRVIKSEPKSWSYSDFNSLYSAMDFILNADPFTKGVVNKRLYLVKAYDYIVPDSLKAFINDHIEDCYKILYNVIFFGKCLIRIKKDLFKHNITIIPPQKYYVLDNEIVPLGEDLDISNTLFFGNELFDISCIALSITPKVIAKEHNDMLWYNNNILLNGFIHTSTSKELENTPDLSLDKVTDTLVRQVEQLAQTSGVLNTPAGIDIQHKDIVNTGVGQSYRDYINEKEREIENIILGRSTQQTDSTYASEKIRYLSTTDIQFADVKTLEHIVNTVISFIDFENSAVSGAFKINTAVDEDELSMIQVLNGLKSLDASDSAGAPLMLAAADLSKLTGIPLLNKGIIKLQAPQGGGTLNAGAVELGAGDLGAVSNVAATALNGAQIASLLSILEQVSAGLLPKATATTVISASFPMIDIATIQGMVEPIQYNPDATLK